MNEIPKAVLPQFLEYQTSIIHYGAVADRYGELISESNAKAIQKAIDEVSEKGGGTVIIPEGIWFTGPIVLKSYVNLHLEHQAVMKFYKCKRLYPLILTDYEGTKRIRTKSPITASYAENIAITGDGVIDGSGDLWRPVKEWKVTAREWKQLLHKGGEILPTKEGGFWFPTSTAAEGCRKAIEGQTPDILLQAEAYYDYYRPVMISLKHCNKVLLEGVTFTNSPAWNIHPYFCSNLTVRNAVIRNDYAAQNGDGIDVESCRNVHLEHLLLETGDDAICLKAGKDKEGRMLKGPCENIWIHDCVVNHAHGGFVIGSEMSRGVRNVRVERCNFAGTDIGVRIKSCLGRGGVVENITVRNINMMHILHEAILLTMSYHPNQKTTEQQKQEWEQEWAQEDIPQFQKIQFEQIHVWEAQDAFKIETIPGREDCISQIGIRDSMFMVDHMPDLRNQNVKLEQTTFETI